MRLLLLARLVSAYSSPVPTSEVKAAFAANATPSDARLAALYTQACKVCHADPASGAPLVGDAQA